MVCNASVMWGDAYGVFGVAVVWCVSGVVGVYVVCRVHDALGVSVVWCAFGVFGVDVLCFMRCAQCTCDTSVHNVCVWIMLIDCVG